MPEQLERLIIDPWDARDHVPEEELAIWWRRQGASVDITVDQIKMINQSSLAVHWIATK